MESSDAVKQAIERLVTGLRTAWNQHDARAFAAHFAEDADFTNVFGMHMRGRAAVERAHLVLFQSMFRDSHWAADMNTDIRLLRYDVASIDVRWRMTGAHDAQGDAWSDRHGLISAVAMERSGQWVLVVFHNQDLPPPERVAEMTKLLAPR